MPTYYVDSTTASTTWASATNIATPCTPGTAMSNAAAGDVVYFRAGTYSPPDALDADHPAWYPTNDGTAGNYITFMAYPGETVTILDANNNASTGYGAMGASRNSYIIFDGFTFNRDKDPGTGASHILRCFASDHIIFRNLDLIGVPQTDSLNGCLANIGGDSGTKSTDIDIYNCKFHGKSGNSFTVNAAGMWLFEVDRVNIYRCNFYTNHMGLAWKGNPDHVSVYQSYFYSCDIAVKPHQEGTSTRTGFYIHHNICRQCTQFVELSDAQAAAWDDLQIYNNTVYHSSAMAGVIQIGDSSNQRGSNIVVYNNIMSVAGTTTTFQLFFNSINAANLPSTADYNCYHTTGATRNWRLNATTYNTLANWQAALGAPRETHSITTIPSFVNAGGTAVEDYQLNGGGCVGTGSGGVDMGAWQGQTVIGYSASSTTTTVPESLLVGAW